jgi:RHS repeat-associated protein
VSVLTIGELSRKTGPAANANPFRFSTKLQDDESDLLYYGFRYYNPSAGRWENRDPLQENGGVALYCLVVNNPIANYDYLGLVDKPNWSEAKSTRQWRYERFSIVMTLPCDSENYQAIINQMYLDIRDFRHFAPNNATLTLAPSVNGLPGRKGIFDIHWTPDAGRIEVQLAPNRSDLMVRAMTLNWHPLVGVRRWGLQNVASNPLQIEFFTDAWKCRLIFTMIGLC